MVFKERYILFVKILLFQVHDLTRIPVFGRETRQMLLPKAMIAIC